MPSLFVGNFDFEHRLAYGNGPLPVRLEAVNARLASTWVTIAEPGDAVWVTSPEAAARLERLAEVGLPPVRPVFKPLDLAGSHRPVFWGENDWAYEFSGQWDLEWRGCDPAIVRRVNSRRFKHQLETELGVSLDGAACSSSIDDLASAVETLAGHPRVLKGEFGGAGREVRFGAASFSVEDITWAENRFRRGLAVTVEPRLHAVEEAGIQFEIHRDSLVQLLGVTPLLTRPNGGYLGSGFRDDPSLFAKWKEAIEICTKAARRVAAAGYFGPLGIDAMRYRDATGEIHTRALQDLNARYTMGRLALGMRRFPNLAAARSGVFRPAELCYALSPSRA